MGSKAAFHPYGIVLDLPSGQVVLNAGPNMRIFPQGNLITFQADMPDNAVINTVTPWQPPTLADAAAPKNSVYFSSTGSKLSYKDASGTIHALY